MLAAKSHSQEAIRMSLASEQAAAAEKATNDIGYYNAQAGPVRMALQEEMGVELNDDANYSKTNPDADVILHPALNVRAGWRATEQNALSLAAGLGYAEYLHDHALSGLRIASDSGVGCNIYSGDFVFNLHDRFSAVEYQIQDPAVSASVIRLENTAGLETTWDLYKLILTAAYDYDMFDSLTKFYQYSDSGSHLFEVTTAMTLSPASKLGLQTGAGLTAYGEHVLENDTHYSIGPFYKTRLTRHLSAEVSAGVASYQFDHDATTRLGDFTGLYGQARLVHELNQAYSQSISLGRAVQRGITADLSELYSVNYAGWWHFLPKGYLGFRFSYGQGSTAGAAESVGFLPEKYHIVGPGLSLSWRFSRQLAATASYDYLRKNSDEILYAFAQNRLLLDATYAF